MLHVIGQFLQHHPQVATGLACCHHRHQHVGKVAWVLRQGIGQAGAAIHLRSQIGQQIALGLRFTFVRQGTQRPFQRQAGSNEAAQAAGPGGKISGSKNALVGTPGTGTRCLRPGAACLRTANCQYGKRHQALAAQLRTGGLGGISLQNTFAGLAVLRDSFKRIGRHGSNAQSTAGAYSKWSRVTRTSSSREVILACTRRSPSSRRRRMPAATALARMSASAARW